jgi:hypothetical protein
VLLIAVAPASLAQEADDQDDDGRFRRYYFEAGAWVAQPRGLDYRFASDLNPNNPFRTDTLSLDDGGTETNPYFRLDVKIGNSSGGLRAIWYGQTQEGPAVQVLDPGNYRFGEIQAHPLFAGFNNDGLADGVEAVARTSLNDLRIEYFNTAFSSKRWVGTWYAGIRRVKQNRDMEVDYFSILNDLPPQLDPLRPDLQPGLDSASLGSQYDGRGADVGIELEFFVMPKRLAFMAGLGITALRGTVSTEYTSETNFYVLDEPSVPPRIIGAPYDEFSDMTDIPGGQPPVPTVDFITQNSYPIGLESSESISGSILDTYLGFKWVATGVIDVNVGWRTTQYDGIGMDLKPVVVTAPTGVGIDGNGNLVGVNVQNSTKTPHSATYEGFYLSVGVRW